MKSNDPPQTDWLRDLDLWQRGLRLLGLDDTALTGRTAVDRIAARFASKVGRRGDCLIWVGSRMPHGYGRLSIAGKSLSAHRVALAVGTGLDLQGFVARHSCDNPPCVTPAHLQRGTQLENVADRVDRGRNARGERSAKAKLTEAQILEIRAARAAGELGSVLAARYRVTTATISRIDTGQAWRHVA